MDLVSFDENPSFDFNPQVGPVPKGFRPGPWQGEARPNPAYRVDINRGVHIRFLSQTGAAVYMFLDRPGFFFNELGREVTAEIAHEAGYDTERLLKLRRRNEAREMALAAVDAEFEMNKRTIVEERGEYRIVELRPDFYNVEFEDGTVLNGKGPVPLDVAKRLFTACLGEKAVAEVSQPAEASGPKKGK